MFKYHLKLTQSLFRRRHNCFLNLRYISTLPGSDMNYEDMENTRHSVIDVWEEPGWLMRDTIEFTASPCPDTAVGSQMSKSYPVYNFLREKLYFCINVKFKWTLWKAELYILLSIFFFLLFQQMPFEYLLFSGNFVKHWDIEYFH